MNFRSNVEDKRGLPKNALKAFERVKSQVFASSNLAPFIDDVWLIFRDGGKKAYIIANLKKGFFSKGAIATVCGGENFPVPVKDVNFDAERLCRLFRDLIPDLTYTRLARALDLLEFADFISTEEKDQIINSVKIPWKSGNSILTLHSS